MNAAVLAYAGYLTWLLAGLGDFACHRRQHLAQTSGAAESAMHLVQLALLGAVVVIWLAFEPSLTTLGLQAVLVCAHAVAGYLDTRVAYGRRAIPPVEQHLHSVLDMAPWIALAVLLVSEGRLAQETGWVTALRTFDADHLRLCGLVLLPPLLLCVLPASLEFLHAMRVARGGDPDISSARLRRPH